MVVTTARSAGIWGPAGDLSARHPPAHRVGKTVAGDAGVAGQAMALALSDAGTAPVGVFPSHGGAGGVRGVVGVGAGGAVPAVGGGFTMQCLPHWCTRP